MNLKPRLLAPLAIAAVLSACSLSSVLGGGGKVPASLLTLTPEIPPPGEFERSANAGQAVTINTPVTAKELHSLRIPVQVSPTDIQYVTDAQWIDMPGRLFQDLLAETVRRRTNRVVLDPRQAGLDPGLIVSGDLRRFGYDASTGEAVVRFDATLSTEGGTRVETRRFEAAVPTDGSAATIGQALNRAANEVAVKVADWIGSR